MERVKVDPREIDRVFGTTDVVIYLNNEYQVAVKETFSHLGDPVTHLSIKRIDQRPVHDWRDMQRIKNEICGEEREAVELYPAESRMVDGANQFHLWVLPVGYAVPLGFTERLVSDHPWPPGVVQRPFAEKPADIEAGNQQVKDWKAKTEAVIEGINK